MEYKMKIEEKIEKYLMREGKKLKKASQKEAIDKIMKTIKSVNDEKQLPSLYKMVQNYLNIYGDGWLDDNDLVIRSLIPKRILDNKPKNKMYNAIKNKEEMLKFLKSQKNN